MIARFACLVVLVGVVGSAFGKIPSYIHVCKRNDPNIEKCIIKAIDDLKPKLSKGIPELDVPSMEPLHLPKVEFSRGANFRATGKNVVVSGASKFKITGFKADVENVRYVIDLKIPNLEYVADYDVNMKVLGIFLKGTGSMKANTADIVGHAILTGHKEERKGKLYVKFDRLELKLKWKSYNIKLGNLFKGDEALNETVNNVLNSNQEEIIEAVRPVAEEVTAGVLLEIANKVTRKFTFDELYPL